MSVSVVERERPGSPSRPIAAPTETPYVSQGDRLAQHADLLATWLRRPARCPQRWRAPQFGRVVDLVRAHLRPIVDRDLLVRSYAREHFHVVAVDQRPAPNLLLARDATEVAYAVRWLELDDDRSWGAWPSVVGTALPE